MDVACVQHACTSSVSPDKRCSLTDISRPTMSPLLLPTYSGHSHGNAPDMKDLRSPAAKGDLLFTFLPIHSRTHSMRNPYR